MFGWIGNNKLFVVLSAMLITAIVLALGVGDLMQDALSPVPMEVSLRNPLIQMSAFDLEKDEETLLDFSENQTILFVLRKQDLAKPKTLSLWNRVSRSAKPGTRVCGLLVHPTDLGPLSAQPHFKLLRATRTDQLLTNGISGTPTMIAVRRGGALGGFWIGHPDAEKSLRIIRELERLGFLQSAKDLKVKAYENLAVGCHNRIGDDSGFFECEKRTSPPKMGCANQRSDSPSASPPECDEGLTSGCLGKSD